MLIGKGIPNHLASRGTMRRIRADFVRVLFDDAVNYHYTPFKDALMYLSDVTKRCS